MRKFLLLFLMTGAAMAQSATTTTYTGTLTDLAQQPITSGQVTFTLTPSTDSTLPGTGRFIPSTINCNINADGTLSGFVAGAVSGPCVVTRNTAITPGGTAYRICIQANFQTPGSCWYDYATTATKDISTPAPTLSTGPLNYNGVPGPPLDFAGTWSSSVSYSIGQMVVFSNVSYISLANQNLNNTPASSPSSWSQVQPIPTIVPAPSGTQTITQPVNTSLNVATSGTGKQNYNGNELVTRANTVQTDINTNQQVAALNGDLNPLLFPGSDLGAKILAAIAASPFTKVVVKIPASSTPYTWSTLVTIDPRMVSIIGAGSTATVINCTALSCLKLFENTFTLDQGGIISGFSLVGNGAANQIGIESAGVIEQKWDDLLFSGFTGTGAISLYFNNSNTGNGWQERTRLSRVRVMNGNGIDYNYNTAVPLAVSFGYSSIDVTCDDVEASQYCVQVQAGWLYNSVIRIQGNVGANGTLLNVLSAGELFGDNFIIQSEPAGGVTTAGCINVAVGAKVTGQGDVDCAGMLVTDANASSFEAHLRIIQSTGSAGSPTALAGTVTNFLGSGNTVISNTLAAGDLDNKYVTFGSFHGPNVDSPYTTMLNGAGNAFVVYACPFAYTSLSVCNIVGQINTDGKPTFSGLAGTGNALACVDPNGKFYRGTATTCP